MRSSNEYLAMTLTERLELDKEKLIALLKEAGTPERAIPVLESETDRLSVAAAEELTSERQREAAGQMLRAVRMSLRFADSLGELRTWTRQADGNRGAYGSGKRDERGRTEKAGFRKALPPALLIAGIVLIVVGFIAGSVSGLNLLSTAVTPLLFVLFALGAVCLYVSGYLSGRGSRAQGAGTAETMTETVVDAEKLYRSLRAVMLVVDQCLKECASAESFDDRRTAAASAEGVSAAELELFASLLEASCSGDAELMKERIEGIRYYLHRNHIEVLDCTPATKDYFDLLPSPGQETLRPALVSEGKALRRGLASATAAK